MKVWVSKDQRALLYRHGDYKAMLKPGKHRISRFWGYHSELYQLDEPFRPPKHLRVYLEDKSLASELEVLEVKDGEIVICLENGRVNSVLTPGQHAFWKTMVDYSFIRVTLDGPHIPEDISETLLRTGYLSAYVNVIDVEPHEEALLYFDGEFQKILKPGRYYYWKTVTKITLQRADLRQLQLDIGGQEIMTADRVTIRLNFVCQYKIVDSVKALADIKGYEEQLYVLLQLILREYVGQVKLDDLLGRKEEIGDYVLKKLSEKGKDWGLEFIYAGLKDIILPGEIKAILNQVIEAEKRAQANIITRREETASTRSLLNTAKLMEDNPILLRMKEMESIERISDKISSLSVIGGGQLIEQLAHLFKPADSGK